MMEREPYSLHKIHRTTNAEDGIFRDQSGKLSIASIEAVKGSDLMNGARASIVAALDPSATPAPVGRGGFGRGGPGRGGQGRRG